jgi:hypothetical protein
VRLDLERLLNRQQIVFFGRLSSRSPEQGEECAQRGVQSVHQCVVSWVVGKTTAWKRRLASRPRFGSNPVEVGRQTPDDIDRNDLREFIRMQRHDTFTQRGKTFNRGLDQQQAFIAAPNLAFPAIRRYDARKPVDAGCKAFLDECAAIGRQRLRQGRCTGPGWRSFVTARLRLRWAIVCCLAPVGLRRGPAAGSRAASVQ